MLAHVNLYTYSSLKCIKAAETLNAAAGYVLEFPTGKGDVTRTQTFLLCNVHKENPKMTGTEANLFVIEKALSRINAHTELDIYTEWASIYGAIANGWLKSWEQNGWTNSDGRKIASLQSWQRVATLLRPHLVTVYLQTEHKYRSWLQREVETERRYVEIE